MIGVAVYVCDTDRTRTKKYPFAEHMDCPRQIQDADTGLTYSLVARHYEVDTADIDATQARVREWNAKRHGRRVA
jgi:hypothetical protein